MSAPLPKLPHVYTEGDQLPKVTGFLEETDLTGYTVTLRLEQPDGTLVEKVATITDAPSGMFEFGWDATDLVAGLGQSAEVEFKDAATLQLTSHRFLIDVEEALG